MPSVYDAEFLEFCRTIEDNNSRVILNPRDLNEANVFYADMLFRRALNLHRQWVRYYYDKKRP